MRFEVTGHYEMPVRGAFVLGQLRSGSLHPGLVLRGNSERAFSYTLAGVESLSGNEKHMHALIFQGKPCIADLLRAFPVGTIICAEPGLA